MPWTTDRLESLISEARTLLLREFPDNFSASIYICSQAEMIDKTKEEMRETLARFVIGKYFAKENMIWLVEGNGVNLPTLIHELLHSIQKCSPHREQIVEYIVYKLLEHSCSIDQALLRDWEEIETSVGFDKIKERLLSEGDCEDY